MSSHPHVLIDFVVFYPTLFSQFHKNFKNKLLSSAFTGNVLSCAPTHIARAEEIELYQQIHTLSCVSVRERWRIRPPLFCQLMCARLQTQSREPPAAAQPVSGRRPDQTATGAEEGQRNRSVITGRLATMQSGFHVMIHHIYREIRRKG